MLSSLYFNYQDTRLRECGTGILPVFAGMWHGQDARVQFAGKMPVPRFRIHFSISGPGFSTSALSGGRFSTMEKA